MLSLKHFIHTIRWFMRAQSERQFDALSGSVHIKKSSLKPFKACGVQRAEPLVARRNGRNLFSPKSAQQGVAKYPQVFCVQFPKGFAGRYSKGVPYEKSPLDAGFFHKRASLFLSFYAVRWNYVGRHGAADKQLFPSMTVQWTVIDGRRQRTANSPPDKPKSPRTPLTGAHGLFFMQNQSVS